MPRSVWKGAISFGLIHVPVSMFPATQDSGVDFDWLDRRSLDPVGYSRVNKRTNKAIDKDDVVKGVKTADGSYAIIEETRRRAQHILRLSVKRSQIARLKMRRKCQRRGSALQPKKFALDNQRHGMRSL